MVKMTSFEVIPPQSNAETGTEEGSSEFIVFSNTPSAAGSLSTSAVNMSELQMNVMSASSDLTPEELNYWLKELICGNMALKAALQRSNSIMHEQVNTVTAWREQMLQANSSHVHMLEEAKKTIRNLQEENELLKKKFQDKDYIQFSGSSADSCVQCAVLEKKIQDQQETIAALELAKKSLVADLEKQQNQRHQLEKNMEAISVNLGSLQCNSRTLEKEKRELTALNNQLVMQISNMSVEKNGGEQGPTVFCDDESGYAIVLPPDVRASDKVVKLTSFDDDGLKGALLELHEERLKVGELTQELAEERAQVACLKKLLEEKSCQVDVLSSQVAVQNPESVVHKVVQLPLQDISHQSANNTVPQGLELSHPKLLMAATYAQKYKERCDSLQFHMKEYEEKLQQLQASDNIVIEQLRQEVKNLQQILRGEQIAYQEDKKNLLESKQNLEQLTQDYNLLLKVVKTQADEQKAKNVEQDDAKGQERRLHMEQLDFLTAKLVNTQQQLEAEEQKVNLLKKKILDLGNETEAIPILKAQVELYKSDFENEKIACESAKSEIEKLKKEVKSLKGEQYSSPYHGTNSRRKGPKCLIGSPGTSLQIKKPHRKTKSPDESQCEAQCSSNEAMECPCCMQQFKDVHDITNHVERCLNEDLEFV